MHPIQRAAVLGGVKGSPSRLPTAPPPLGVPAGVRAMCLRLMRSWRLPGLGLSVCELERDPPPTRTLRPSVFTLLGVLWCWLSCVGRGCAGHTLKEIA